jgi:3-methyladenine DNA glycosylase Tag
MENHSVPNEQPIFRSSHHHGNTIKDLVNQLIKFFEWDKKLDHFEEGLYYTTMHKKLENFNKTWDYFDYIWTKYRPQ